MQVTLCCARIVILARTVLGSLLQLANLSFVLYLFCFAEAFFLFSLMFMKHAKRFSKMENSNQFQEIEKDSESRRFE